MSVLWSVLAGIGTVLLFLLKGVGILLLVLFVLVAGFLARMQAPGYESWLLWHIFSAELVLILAPFTKLSHIVLYFMSRGQLGMDYAIKRGGASRGPAFPW